MHDYSLYGQILRLLTASFGLELMIVFLSLYFHSAFGSVKRRSRIWSCKPRSSVGLSGQYILALLTNPDISIPQLEAFGRIGSMR